MYTLFAVSPDTDSRVGYFSLTPHKYSHGLLSAVPGLSCHLAASLTLWEGEDLEIPFGQQRAFSWRAGSAGTAPHSTKPHQQAEEGLKSAPLSAEERKHLNHSPAGTLVRTGLTTALLSKQR